MWKVINAFAALTIIALGAILGGEYNNPLHLVVLLSIISYAGLVQKLISNNENMVNEHRNKIIELENEQKRTNKELNQANAKLSTVLFQTNSRGENPLYLAVHPLCRGNIRKSVPVNIQIIMNAPFCVQPPPDIKMITKIKFGSVRLCDKTIFPTLYGEEWEYKFSVSTLQNIENTADKFFCTTIEVQFDSIGNHEYIIEAKSKDFHSRISNSFEVAS